MAIIRQKKKLKVLQQAAQRWSDSQQLQGRQHKDQQQCSLKDEAMDAAETMVAMSRQAAAPSTKSKNLCTVSIRVDQVIPPRIVTESLPNERKPFADSNLQRSLPSTVLKLPKGDQVIIAQPVPEFLCQLFLMLSNPKHSHIISWVVPSNNEPDYMGGGIRGIGMIVVHNPNELQESVLGEYYHHSKYASFQRQLNYFSFKKRLHGGKKGKLNPCSYIHEGLNGDLTSLLHLKRRSPTKKPQSDAVVESSASVEGSSSNTSSNDVSASIQDVGKRNQMMNDAVASTISPKETEAGPKSVGNLPLRKRVIHSSATCSLHSISSGEYRRVSDETGSMSECNTVSDETEVSDTNTSTELHSLYKRIIG
jgi:hypothetical protein